MGLNIPYFIKAYNTNQCEPCQDNETFSCGSFNLDRYSVYHIDPGFGVNQGYKFWQCVQPNLYNHPQDVLDQGIANIILSFVQLCTLLLNEGIPRALKGKKFRLKMLRVLPLIIELFLVFQI